MQSVFVSSVSLGFGNGLRRAYDFLHLVLMLIGSFISALVFFVDMFVVLLVLFVLSDFRGRAIVMSLFFVRFFVVLFLNFVFEDCTAGSCIGVRFFADFILLGFDQAGGKCGGFFVAYFSFFAFI